MARWTGHDEIDDVLAAGAAWRNQCLEADGSVLSSRALWTEENLEALNALFRGNPIQGNDASFLEKLRRQLAGAPPAIKQLASEVVWLVLLFPHMSKIQPATKRANILAIWSTSGEPQPPDDRYLSDRVLSGVGGVGTYYQTGIPNEFGFAVEVALGWKRRPLSERDLGIGEDAAWAFATWVDGLRGADKRPVRHAILYFCYPDFFERNVSTNHRQSIYQSLAGKLSGIDHWVPSKRSRVALDRTGYRIPEQLQSEVPTGVALDEAIFEIRTRLSKLLGTDEIDFYRPPLQSMWNIEDREKRRKLAASGLEGVLSNYGLELHQTGSKKPRLFETRPTSERTGFWDNPGDATNKPLRWLLQVDIRGNVIRAHVPDAHGSDRVAFFNSAKGISGAVFARVVPAMKLSEGHFEFYDTWEWILMFCFLPALAPGSGAQLIEGFDPATGMLTYKGKQQPYVWAGLIALNDPDALYVAETENGPKQVKYAEATTAIRNLIHVPDALRLEAPGENMNG